MQELIGVHLQGSRQFFEVIERNIARAALHMGDEGAMQTGLQGQGLLRPAFAGPQDSDVFREELSRGGRAPGPMGWRGSHTGNCDKLYRLSQPRLSHIYNGR
jgi:hypothetical protein